MSTTPVQFHRENGYILHYATLPSVTCHNCGSGEVVQPTQTLDMPMSLKCLRCGVFEEAAVFVPSETNSEVDENV